MAQINAPIDTYRYVLIRIRTDKPTMDHVMDGIFSKVQWLGMLSLKVKIHASMNMNQNKDSQKDLNTEVGAS